MGSGCTGPGYSSRGPDYEGEVERGSVLRRMSLHRATEDAILALSPEDVSERDLRQLLVQGPAPRIINLNGSLPVVSMRSFSEFLVAMGYPEARVRNPTNGAYSYSSHVDSQQLAGMLAWYYEREGMMPIMIGHSQGGMLAIRVLHELAGAFRSAIRVWNPLKQQAEERMTILDPLTGEERPLVGLRVGYAAALATGKPMRVLLGQWSMLPRLRQIPDTAEAFTGFSIEWDLLAGTLPGLGPGEPYRATGSASVRNVTLPAEYNHLTLPRTRHLAEHEGTRAWINRYIPGAELPPSLIRSGIDTRNILLAADLWYGIKKTWCLEAQRLIRARRGLLTAAQ
jgi:hypothetical protein